MQPSFASRLPLSRFQLDRDSGSLLANDGCMGDPEEVRGVRLKRWTGDLP